MSLPLTAPFATSELPRLGIDPVTVTVSRDIATGREADFEAWAEDVEEALVAFPGCLGVGVLKAAEDGGRYHVVFRFTDLISLRRWERSPERLALLDRLDECVLATRVQRTVGVGAPGRRQTLPDLVRDYLRGRPLPAELDREEFVRLGGDLMDTVERDLAGT